MRFILLAGLGTALIQTASGADEKTEFKDQKQKVSYGIGVNIGNNLKRTGYDVDVDVLAGAIRDVLGGKELKMNEQQAREALMAYNKELTAKREEERLAKAEKNHKEGEKFLAENKTKEGVKTHTVNLPDGTTAELQYKVLTEGKGALPRSNDFVTVNYQGTLVNGTEFDSSTKRGQAQKFSINGVPKGWTEALKMMPIGSKWQLFVPSILAYGDRGGPFGIEPGATLIYELELTGTEAPAPPPPPAQPLTSDIIKVPSAEELKKGAKIEVIKPEDVEKKIKEDQEKAKEKKP